ncbi:AEC family transporter [Flammeovirga pectinis]|uniref:AEC family transporter n=1 Tax=Flammeovirga pectinis TaxID=2494373 RepID=A0A3Q9FT63_9BACT|nr:AEC family transporter [Flammeovirga pectinis]AZQ64046.1 AEC family transporter [Flammeovirga pectinis]
MIKVFNSVLPIIILLVIGYLCRQKFIKDKSFWSNINKLIYYIMFPTLMVYSISKSNFSEIDLSFIPILVLIILGIMGVIWLLKPFFKNERFWVVFIQGAVRYNSYVFIVVTLLYVNTEVMPIIALITAFLVMTTNIVSVFILSKYSENKLSLLQTIKSTITNPLVFSCFLGLFVNYIATIFPGILKIVWLNSTLNYIGKASLTLSLISVGASINLQVFKENFYGILGCSFIKLLLLPLIVVSILSYFEFSPVLILVCMIYAGSPCSSNATAMTETMGGDHESMSLIISTQTVLSVFSLTLLLYCYSIYFGTIQL